MRYSKQRQAIYDAVCSTSCHPDAEWVYEQTRKQIPNVSKGTVYRDLKELVQAGRIDSLETTHDKLRFDGNLTAHAHFICRTCERVFDFPLVRKPSAPVGFVCDKQKHLFYGICEECNGKAQ